LGDLVREHTGGQALIDVEVDPSLIGGFIFDIDDAMIDTSVASQLEAIRLQYIEKNRRIV
jgi:F-type H+-transporting ATPase subunit delta